MNDLTTGRNGERLRSAVRQLDYSPRTHTIANGRGRLLIAEHPTECFICVDADGAGTSMFLTSEQCMEAAGELLAIARRIKRRS